MITIPASALKKITKYLLSAFIVALYLAARGMDDCNYFINSAVLKPRLVSYIQKRFGTDVAVGSLHAVITPRPGVSFRNVSIGRPEGFHAAADGISLIFSPLRRATGGDWLKRVTLDHLRLSMRIDSLPGGASLPEFSLPEIELRDPELSIQSRGRSVILSGPLRGRFRVFSGTNVSIVGRMTCEGTEVRLNDEAIRLSGSVTMNGRELSTPGLDIAAGDLTVSARGTYSWNGRRSFNGSVRIEGLAVSAKGGGSRILDYLLEDLHGGADITMADMTLFSVPVETVTARAVADGGTLVLNDLRAEGGPLSGGGTVTLAPQRPASFDVSFTLLNYDIMKLLGQVSSGDTLIRGALNLSGRVWGSGQSINGEVSLSSFNGRLMKFGPMFKIFTAVNFHKMILQKHPDLRSRGFPYQSIVSDFSIRDSIATFRQFYLDSDSIQLSASGTYSIRTSSVDALMGIRPLDLLDRTVGMIPVLGWILEGKENAVIIMYLRLLGNINDPRVTLAPMQNLTRGIGGMLLRTLLLPYTLITRPANLIPALNDRRPGAGAGNKKQ